MAGLGGEKALTVAPVVRVTMEAWSPAEKSCCAPVKEGL